MKNSKQINQRNWKNFKESELVCSCCGEFNPNEEFITLMQAVQTLRDLLGFPIGVSSAYRCKNHPIEARKIKKGKSAGQHNLAAIDLKVSGNRAQRLLKEAFSLGFTGIGISQKGQHSKRFIHLDFRDEPTVWSY